MLHDGMYPLPSLFYCLGGGENLPYKNDRISSVKCSSK